MGKGYKHGASGGTDPLNFYVKTYPSEVELKADKPKENTIGVITTTTMTSWVFSATEPKEPEVGMVWISVGNESSVEFNALKKDTLQVYPNTTKQYVNGAFAGVVSFTYQNGEWVDWAVYILNLINSFTTKRESGTGSITIDNGTVTATTTGTSSSNQGSVMYFGDEKIDLSKYKTLSFHVKNTGIIHTLIGFWSENTSHYYWDNMVATKTLDAPTSNSLEEDVTVDISGVNSLCYFGIGVTGVNSTANAAGTNTTVVSEIKLLD